MQKVLTALFIVLAAFFSSCENDIEKVKLVSGKNNFPAETAKKIEIVYSDSAIVRLKIKAPVMDHFINENPYIEMPKGIDVEFYDRQMNVENKLTANHAVKYEQKHTMEARGNVVVVNAKGDKLNTEHLVWDEYQQKIFSKEFVKITTNEEIIYGNGFEANQDFTNYKIFNIKGIISLKK